MELDHETRVGESVMAHSLALTLALAGCQDRIGACSITWRWVSGCTISLCCIRLDRLHTHRLLGGKRVEGLFGRDAGRAGAYVQRVVRNNHDGQLVPSC